jgi:hypothetical protein
MKNYWIGIINPIHGDVLSYIASPESYAGNTSLLDIQVIVSFLHDPKTVIGLFKASAGRYLYSFYVDADRQSDYEQLLSDYPSLLVLGGWDTSEGARIVDLHPSLLNHMPDAAGLPATEIENINTLGNHARDFS